jgi:hypothetical protein
MVTKTKAKTNGSAPMEVTLDARQQVRLKNRDMIDFQRVTGKTFVAWITEFERAKSFAADDKAAQLAFMASIDWTDLTALLWIFGRRDNPGFTWEDALDADIDQDTLMMLPSMIADPTEPASTTTPN